MIPVRLRLRNFLSYGEGVPPLEFAGIRLACLCGENGHGKSALLDAITWALWGRARISDRRDSSEDELIHLGKSEMEVEFEFELDGERYCVVRKRAVRVGPRRRTSTGVLEFQVAEGGGYRPLTGDSMHATQRLINQVLRLDYETFVNSAFILQGRADEFTRKTATERKRILADLLGLGYYDELEERAREQARRFEAERRESEAAIAEIDRELEREPEHRRELARLGDLLADLDAEADRHEQEVARLRGLLRELELKAAHRLEVQARVQGDAGRLKTIRAQVARAEERLREHAGLVEQAAAIREGHRELVAARQVAGELDAKFQRLHELAARRSEVELAIARARSELEGRAKVAAAEVARLRRELAREPGLRAQESDLRAQLAGLDRTAGERDAAVQEVEELRAQLVLLESTNAKLKEDGTLVKERLDLLAGAGARCPICESELDEAGIERLRARFDGERNRMLAEYRSNAAKAREIEGRIADAQKRVQAADEALRRRQALERSHANAEKALEDLAKCRQDLVAAEAEHAAVAQRLAAGDYARAEREEAARLAAEEAGLGYDKALHQQVRSRLNELARYEGLLARLEVAETAVPQAQAELANLTSLERDVAAQVAAGNAQLADLDRELQVRPSLDTQLAEARRALDDVVKRQSATREARGEAQQRLNHCDYLRGERARRAAAQAAATLEKGLYEDLAAAFGKKGIQAMIIESVIPEIELEANAVLARMTDGRLNVKLETQRDARSGDGTIETLDIRISDELGVRNLELYSGGEAFRVNFAIRIALSKLLARRAGARVQTLVIDEGFGTQDSFGRQRLIEAINSVVNDFEKIIVITHIDELKDAFPTRIDVVKGPEGSQISVN